MTDDPGRIDFEESANVPEWLETAFWTAVTLALLALIAVKLL